MDLRTDINDYVVINDGATNILSKMVSNKRVETNHALSHAVDFSTLNAVEVAPLPATGEPCYLNHLYTDGTNYTCIQAHDRTIHPPEDIPALFRQYRAQGLQWVQPISTNPYQENDWVTHNGDSWVSIIMNNVWEPSIPGSENLWNIIEDI